MSGDRRGAPGAPPEAPRPFFFARVALAMVAPTIVYASLRPFHGWRDPGPHPFSYLRVPAEFGSPFDALLNFAGYLLLGLCLALALFPRWRGRSALAIAALVPTLGSVLVEAAQSYLPGRFPSVVDVGMNALGAWAGAALAVCFTPWMADHRGGRHLRQRWFESGTLADAGLLLLASWFVSLFAQRSVLFGSGDIRGNLQVAVQWGVPAIVFGAVEVFVVAANLVVVGLMLRLVLAERMPRSRALFALAAFIAAALVMRVVAQLAFWEPAAALRWMTPAALTGLAVGSAVAIAAQRLSRRVAAASAMLLLTAGVIVVNVAPPDPALWLQPTAPREQLLIGLTLVARYASKGWPLAAMVYLGFVLRTGRG